MKMKRHFAQFLVFAAITFVSLPAFASNQRFIVVLDPHGKLTDKEVAAAGGTIEERFLDRWVVMLPSADALRGNPGVKYVQPIGGSRDLTPLPDDIRTTSASRARIESTQTWGPMSYSYDAAGNIYAIGGDTFRYDLDSRLTQWTRSGDSSATETYGYDAYGNMTSYKRFGQSSVATISVDASTNHLSSDTYDHGNDVSFGTTSPQTTVVYDSLNMPVQTGGASGTAYYLYTADDERIGVLTADTWNWSLRGFDHEVLRQFRSANSDPTSPWLWAEDYIYRGGELLAGERPGEEGGRRHFHLDHLGTPRLITGDNGAAVSQHDYTPFGLECTQQNQEIVAGFDREEPKRFTGHERNYLGYSDFGDAPDYMHARFYGSSVTRFLSIDSWPGSPRQPQTWNRYAYTRNNPVKMLDPNGEAAVTFTGGWNPDGPGAPMYNLAAAINLKGNVGAARGFGNNNVGDAFNFVKSQLKINPKQPVIIAGHSWGGAAALELARKLADAGIRVNLLITLDVVGKDSLSTVRQPGHHYRVPSNVDVALNYYQTSDEPGDNRLDPSSDTQHVANIPWANATHTEIDDMLWTRLAGLITSWSVDGWPMDEWMFSDAYGVEIQCTRNGKPCQ